MNGITELVALSCPRCAAGLAARREFWEHASLEQLAGALVPFVIVVAISLAIGSAGPQVERGGKQT